MITLLTDDLLLQILSHLPSSDHKSFRSTCKSFYKLESLHRTHLRILRPEFLSPLLSKFLSLSSLDLSVCPRIDDASVSVILSSSTNSYAVARQLKRLILNRCTGLSVQGLEALVRSCVSLESVDVSYCCGFGDREAAALSCAVELRELCLDKCLNLSDVGLAQIAVGCEKLERLSVKWCFDLTDIGIELLSKKCGRLKYLDISYLKVTGGSLRSIGGMQKLEVLLMVGCGLLDDEGLHYIGKGCPSLQVLDVSRCGQVGPPALVSILKGHNNLLQLQASFCLVGIPAMFVYEFNNLSKLKVLRIDGAQVSDSILDTISIKCRFLTEIGLGKCEGVTDIGITMLVCGCLNLRNLDLTCCSDLSDLSIISIAYSCEYVVCLKLECINLLSEKGLYFLGSFSMLLEEIDLTDCPGINDMGLKHLSNCLGLLSLKLGLCPNVSDKGLFFIASNCKQIRELDLYRCVAIGDYGLVSLSRGCTKLRKLILSYCTSITDRGIGSLGSLEELSDLELRSLPNVTGAGLSTLAAGCRRLTELDVKHCENIDDSGFGALAYYSKNLQQINLSGCKISDMGLCILLGNLSRIQDVKLLNLANVSVNGLELALRTCCSSLKKLKLVAPLRRLLSLEIVDTLETRGCKIRWD